MLLINWLTKVTNDPIVQGASPVNVIGIGSNEIVGMAYPTLMRCLWSSTPVIAGTWTSAIKQAV
jgi:hypothetical protein